MRLVTLPELVRRIRDRADMTRSQFVTDAEIIDLIDEEATALYDKLIRACEDYSVKWYEATPDENFEIILPDDFYKLLNIYTGQGLVTSMLPRSDSNPTGYFLTNNVLTVFGTGQRSGDLRIKYVPTFQKMTKLGDENEAPDTFDGVNGWEKYIILGVAIKLLAKEESDPSFLLAEKQQVVADLDLMISRRDFEHEATITRTNPNRITGRRRFLHNEYPFF